MFQRYNMLVNNVCVHTLNACSTIESLFKLKSFVFFINKNEEKINLQRYVARCNILTVLKMIK